MTNVLEVCQWLIKRPKILSVANQMFNALDIPLDSPLVNELTETAKPNNTTPDIEKAHARLWGEEIKCLFLRCRSLSDEIIGDFVKEKLIMNFSLAMLKRSSAILNVI
jgi:hypothetical protein